MFQSTKQNMHASRTAAKRKLICDDDSHRRRHSVRGCGVTSWHAAVIISGVLIVGPRYSCLEGFFQIEELAAAGG